MQIISKNGLIAKYLFRDYTKVTLSVFLKILDPLPTLLYHRLSFLKPPSVTLMISLSMPKNSFDFSNFFSFVYCDVQMCGYTFIIWILYWFKWREVIKLYYHISTLKSELQWILNERKNVSMLHFIYFHVVNKIKNYIFMSFFSIQNISYKICINKRRKKNICFISIYCFSHNSKHVLLSSLTIIQCSDELILKFQLIVLLKINKNK